MIISHVKIIAFQIIINHMASAFWIFYISRKHCSEYNEEKNTWVLGDTSFISSLFNSLLQTRLQGGWNKKCEHNLARADSLIQAY